MSSTNHEGLRREIGVLGLAANTLNRTIGAGIFVLPAFVASFLGETSILAYLFCGFLMMLIMLCFSEIGSKITSTGGAYAYIHAAFGPFAGFLANTMFWFVGILADAAIANAMADMLSIYFPSFSEIIIRAIFFLFVFGSFALVNVLGVKHGDNMVKINTLIKVVPLIILIVAGFWGTSMENLKWHSLPSISKLGEASLLLFFAFAGGEASLNVSGELKNPQKVVPLGILSGMGAVVLFYILIQTVSQGVLGADLIKFKEAPLAAVANKVIGSFGSTLMLAGAVFSMFAALSGSVLSYPRVIFAGANRGWMPKIMAKVHPKFATPFVAIISYAALDFVFSISGGFKQLAIIASASLLVVYFGVVAATIKLRLQEKGKTEGFRLPFGVGIPILAAISILWFLSNLALKEITSLVIFLGILSVLYLLIVYFGKRNNNQV
ncbi:APC family permease [Lacihabitans soyangensis]|uniref:Amino acid permease n=1 Tax=Lacihabitans soyangensis TaxID=869394 RepID=A0AAE3KVC4_9BACT|nr:APC family permease [Lacihabitans soyangensis]MCP9764046.1 amino acid permease [Lacihabitans soyangensis]